MGPRAAAAALVEQDRAVSAGIEETAMGGFAAGAGPAVEEDGRVPLP